jgi:acyl carrier protein
MNSSKAIEVMDTLKQVLADLGIPVESLRENTLLSRDLQLDSTEIVEIALGLKRKLGVKIKIESQQDKTLADVCESIAKAMSVNSQNVV